MHGNRFIPCTSTHHVTATLYYTLIFLLRILIFLLCQLDIQFANVHVVKIYFLWLILEWISSLSSKAFVIYLFKVPKYIQFPPFLFSKQFSTYSAMILGQECLPTINVSHMKSIRISQTVESEKEYANGTQTTTIF